MLLQRLSRPASACRPLSECAAAIPRLSHPSIRQRRQLHQVPVLPYEQDYVKKGVDGLLSAQGFDTAWTRYQGLMVQRLNLITKGFDAYTASTKQLVLQYARNPATAALFNHASMAHNNHFFFGSLSPAPAPLENYSAIRDTLVTAYGSIETLKQTMLGTADAMFGPGFVWLVVADSGVGNGADRHKWKILTTYLAGTPYAEAGYRQQDKDMNVQNTVGYMGPTSAAGRRAASLPPGAAFVEPVLCVNTWEHVYLTDYGVDGKQKYLSNWWDSINWGEVDVRTPASLKYATLGEHRSMRSGPYVR